MSRKFTAIAITMFLSLCVPTVAQDIDTFVLVPDGPQGGALVSGCFRADRDLYGPFRLTMCLQRTGTYQIRGGGIRCDGRLTWHASGRNVDIHLRRVSCNQGMAWARADVSCRAGTIFFDFFDRIFGGSNSGGGLSPFVLVPDTGNVAAVRTLNCTYHPSVPGERSKTFTARRL